MMIKTFVKVWKSPFLYVILILDNESSKLWKSAGFTNDGPAKKGRNGYEKGPGQNSKMERCHKRQSTLFAGVAKTFVLSRPRCAHRCYQSLRACFYRV